MGPSFRLAPLITLALAGACASGAVTPEPPCDEAEDAPFTVRAVPEGPRGLFLEAIELERELDVEIAAERAGPPHIAWDGRSWHLAWGSQHAVLDETGVLRGEVEGRGEGGAVTALEPGSCRSAVVAAGDRSARSVLTWVDPDGVAQGAIELEGTTADLSRRVGRWWVVTDVSMSERSALALYELAPERRDPAARVEIVAPSIASPRVVATDAGAVVSWVDRAGIVQRAVGRDGDERTQRVMSANVWSRGAMESVLLRGGIAGVDRVAIAATDGALVHVAMTDVEARAVIAGPVAVARTTARDVAPGLAALPERGIVALCHPAGPAPWGGDDVVDRVELTLLGSDASPAARAVEVSRGGEVHAVTCGWSGRELLVAWWRTLEGREQIATRRIRVREGSPPILAAHARPL